MLWQHIFILIAVFFCVHYHTCAVPVQKTELSPDKKNNITKTGILLSDPQNCQYSGDCPEHSECVNGKCKCVRGWDTGKDGVFCSYEKKSKLTAFLLSFLIGNFGADWFYLAQGNALYIIAGIFKLLAACGCCSIIFSACTECCKDLAPCFGCLSMIWSCGGGIWWVVDWIRILADAFPDGNGVSLYDW